MIKEALDYLKTQRVGVLALEMEDGSPHAATVHFANTNDPCVFLFETYSESRKGKALYERKKARASFVVGTNEQDGKTLQMDGVLEVMELDEEQLFESVYLTKFPEKNEKLENISFLMLKFTPTWWRFTDWKTNDGKKIWTSED